MLKFIKNSSLATLYLVLFVVSQTITSFLIIMGKIMTDMEFADRVYNLLSPYYTSDYVIIPEKSADMMITMLELMSDITVPTLLLSNLIVVGIILLSTKGKKNTKLNIERISSQSVFHYTTIGILLNLVISAVIVLLPKEFVETHNTMTSYSLSGNALLVLLSAGILAPVAEELVFRFGMLHCLRRINPIYAVIVQALAFGLLHGNLIQSSYAFVLGLIFGVVVLKTNNLIYSIIMHIAINTSSVITVLSGINEFKVLPIMIIMIFSLWLITQRTRKVVVE